MYLDYWQLESKPFEPACDPQAFFSSTGRKSALHKLQYILENRRSAAVLAGPSGVGKTSLLSSLAAVVDSSCGPFVHVVFPQMSGRDLLVFLSEELGAPSADPPRYTIEESLRRLEFVLTENTRRGRHAVLVVDEAHLLEDSELLEPLRLLLNLKGPGQQMLFSLLLVGQPTLLPMIQRYGPLDERIDVKAVLPKYNAEETASYIRHRLQIAGASRTIFSDEALLAAHELTGGIARRINRLGDLALLVGFAEGRHTIDAAQLREVSAELVNLSPAA
jgi:general secretion pathway protein A